MARDCLCIITSFIALAIVLWSSPASASIILPCSCAPTSVTLALDFSVGGQETGKENISNSGVASEKIKLTNPNRLSLGGNTQFVRVDKIVMRELNQNLVASTRKQVLQGNFGNGDTFTFNFILWRTTLSRMKGFRLIMEGVNSDGVAMQQVWEGVFSNVCDDYPVLEAGDTFASFRIVCLTDAFNLFYCLCSNRFSPSGEHG